MMNKKHHWFYHAVLCGAALLAAIAPSLAQEKSDTKGEGPLVLVSTAPQHLLLGIDLGVERALSPKFSLGADLTTHLWLLETPNIALSPIGKYYFWGNVGTGIYARAKAVVGYFFGKTALDAPYYAGLGIGFGFLLPLGKSKRWYMGADSGIKLAVPFGPEGSQSPQKGSSGAAYYTILSPASIPELSVRIAYSL
ncbi:hypothetical protein [Porphyromonas endodontalis]|uniref:hypothetical protein n=1 Tax=Porphyromonas endodontalis TaxID=28124 RepID=UPI0028E977F6|nr:hypothetical protein [Porphyromonas endodontalis]